MRAECDSAAMLQWMTFWQVSRTVALGASGKKPGFDRYLSVLKSKMNFSAIVTFFFSKRRRSRAKKRKQH